MSWPFTFRTFLDRVRRPARLTKLRGKRRKLSRRLRVEELEPRILLAPAGTSSILLLDPSGKDSLRATGNGKIMVTGSGSITVDSGSAEAALAAGNGQVSAATLFVRGGAEAAGGGTLPGTITPLTLPVSDPLAAVAALTTPPPKAGTNLNISGQTVTLNPGTYVGGIQISGRAVVYLEPGIYYLQGGGMKVSSPAQVVMAPNAMSHPSPDTGTGVLIYNASSEPISVSGQVSMNLVGPTASAYQGIALFQDRSSTAPISISGGAQVTLNGALYAAAAAVSVTGNGNSILTSKLIAFDLQVSGNGTVTAKGPPAVAVADTGGPYTGRPYAATATVNGAATLEGVGLTLDYVRLNSDGTTTDLLNQAPSAAGSYQVTASFPGSADYASASSSTTFTIQQAAPTVQVTDAGGSYSGAAFPASDSVAGVVAGVDTTPASSLEGVSPTLAYYGGTFTTLAALDAANPSALPGAPSAAGSYTAVASFPGSPDYTSARALATFTILQAAPTESVSDAGGTYTGAAFPATATVAGVSGVAGSSLEGFALALNYYGGTFTTLAALDAAGPTALAAAPSAAGPYTVVASFPGSADYSSARALANFSIAQAVPTVSVSDAGGTSTGAAFPATATVAGVSGVPGSSLEGVSPALAYYSGTYITLAALDAAKPSAVPGAPSDPGSYTVVASFAGSADYTGARALANFSIIPSGPLGPFPNAPGFWTVGQVGGSAAGQGGAAIDGAGATLREGDSFDVTLSHTFTVPQQPSALSFSFLGPDFDALVPNDPRDAFEAALVAGDGTSLVHTFRPNRDAFFNLTEGRQPDLGAGTTFDGRIASVNLAGLQPGTQATLVFRLVNNDGTGTSSVRIDGFQIQAAPGATPVVAVPLVEPGRSTRAIDFTALADVSASFPPEYGETSFDQTSRTLYADVAVRNAGTYDVGTPLVVAVSHLSDPSVRVVNADGTTPDGLPYLDFSGGVSGGLLAPGAVTGTRRLSFYNPNRVPFTYDLVVLGALNQAPAFTTAPKTEAIPGVPYVYLAAATDPDGDPLHFTLLTGPAGMAVDAATGKVTWAPQQADLGSHAVALRVDDGRGGSAEQDFTVDAIAAPPNRPPVFTSTPVVDAAVNTPYSYPATATDPDGEPLTFSVVGGPQGLGIGPMSGLLTWTPAAGQLGVQNVTVQVQDGSGGTATQTFAVNVAPEAGNHPPVIISTPPTQFAVEVPGTPTGVVTPGQISLAAGEQQTDHVTVQVPPAPTVGAIDLQPTSMDITGVTTDPQVLALSGTVHVTVRNNGPDTYQTSVAGIFDALVFEDRNGNGAFDPGVDNVLGKATFAGTLPAGAATTLDLAVSGIVQFRDEPLHVMVDSGNLIPETDETNNTLATGLDSRHQPTEDWLPMVKWQWNSTFARIAAAPAIAPLLDTNGDGRIDARDVPAVIVNIATGGFAGRLVALRGDTGAVIFDVPLPADVDANAMPTVGDLDGDGRPEILLGTGEVSHSLYALNNDGTVKWKVQGTPSGYRNANPVLVDLDGDGKSEVLWGSSALNSDGTLRWDAAAMGQHSWLYLGGPVGYGPMQPADLNLDGVPEIIAGASALDRNGRMLWSWRTVGDLATGDYVAQLSVNDGPWVDQFHTRVPLGDGWTAVANLDGDPFPEVIVVSPMNSFRSPGPAAGLWIFRHDGSLFDPPVALLENGVNNIPFQVVGPPTVADFDGDGRPEIAVAVQRTTFLGFDDPTREVLYVFRTDGTEVWHKDLTPGTYPQWDPPPAAFDFDGDGAAELVVQDIQYLYVLDGRTGATRFQLAVNNNYGASPTTSDYPVIADVDNDGHAEIVAFESGGFLAGASPRQGIVVLGDANGNWEHARRSWNQWMYQPAFTNEDGSVPAHARNSWEVQNGLRTQIPLEGVDRAAAPDLSVSQVTVDATNCPTSVTITARVGNGGSLQAGAGVVVDFYLGDPAAGGTLLGASTTTRPLFPGDFEDVSFTWNAPTAGQIVVTVNEPPPAAQTPSADLSLLPSTWAEAYGFNGGAAPANLFVFNGIDGNSATAWMPLDNTDPRPAFYEVHFPFPVEVSSVTLQNALSTWAFLGTGTLTFSNGFSTSINLDATGAGSVTFPEQAGITWIRLTSSATGTFGAGLAEFIAGGSYVQPPFLVPEGDGRLGNNSAALVLAADPCDVADPPPVVKAGPDQTVFDGDAVAPNPATFTDPVLLETHTATIDWGDNIVEPGTVREADGSGSVSGTHRYAGPGTYTVTVSVRDAAGNADSDTLTVKVLAAIYRQPAIDVVASDPAVSLVNLTGPVPGLSTGQTAAFDVRLEKDTPAAFDLLFVRPATGVLLGSIPVVVNSTYSYPVQAVDGDGDPLTFRLPAAPAGATIDASTGVIHWTPSQPSTYDFSVEASDGRGGTATQSYQLTVSAGQPNHDPAITSTPPVRAIVFRDFAYPVTASDPDGDPLAFFLTQAPAGMAIDRTTGRITWRPDRGQAGTAAVTVNVRDPRGGQASQTFTLDVTLDLANQAPVFTSTPPAVADPGQLYSDAVTATDAENDPLSFDLPLRPAGMAIQPTTGLLTWLPGAAQVGLHDVIVRIRDGNDAVTLQHFQVTVRGPNVPPVVVSTPPPQAVQGFPFEYRVQAQDTGGDQLTYHLDGPAGATIDANTGVLSWVPTAAQVGTQSLSVTVVDDRGGATTQTFTVQVAASAANDPPQILSTPRTTIALGGHYAYQVQAIDPDADPLTYHLDTAPAGMTIDAAGLVTWQPAVAEFGANPVVLRVDDGRGGSASQTFMVNVVTQLSDRPPAIVTTPPLTATVGRPYVYDARATDPENDPLMWSFDTAPAGMSIDPQLGTIRWTPAAGEVGLQTAVLRVIDAQGSSVVQNIPVIVRSVDVPPIITSMPPTLAAVGLAYTYQVQASDADHDPLTFSLTALPAGMSINAGSGLIQWAPTAAQVGPQTVTAQVDDGQGGIAVQTYTVVVSATPPDQPPVITSMPRLVAIASTLYQYQVLASDPENETVQFALVAPPAGMTIDPASGLVQWTPGPQQAGQGGVLNLEVVTITATDTAGNVATQRYTVSVRATNQPPVINSQPVTSVLPGSLYGYDVQANDPDGDPLTYHLDTGPQGMTLDAQGRLRWSPAAADTGPHPVALTVSDGLGGTVAQTFSVTVGADTEAPKVSVQVSPNPVNLGAPATVVVSATDNVGVQTLGLTVNGMPVALDTNGRGTVTLSQAGAFDVVATATDAAGNTGRATASLLVIDPTVTGAPTVALAPLPGDGVLTAPVDVIGTATDPNLLFYSLSVGPVDGGPFREIVHGTTPVTNGVLGRLDPTLLANDSYVLRLTATNAGGHTASVDTPFSVMGNLKLGNFTLAFTDLTVPVSGIPITLTRTYDTLQANTSADFGFGWRLEYRDVRLRTSVPKTGEEANGLFNPFRDGTRVYVTLPGGKREGFTFQPVSQFIAGAFYQPHFVIDRGGTDTLTVQGEVSNGGLLGVFKNLAGQGGALSIFRQSDGTYTNDAGIPYNPADDLFGGVYFVTTKDGAKYQIDAFNGKLQSVTDRNGNTLTFTDAGISSSAGPAITFGRNPQGRIVSVTDPMGQSIRYQYDANGDLVAVTDRMNNPTQFVYRTDRPHYLDHVLDPLGRTGARAEYDDQGRMVRVIDASGKAVGLNYDLSQSTETVLDRLGNPATYVYDDRGNVVTEVNALGGVTQRTYDANDNELTVTDPLGNTTTRTYDARGDVLSVLDQLGRVTRSTYDAANHLLTQTDPLGNTIQNTYDDHGNRRSFTDPTGATTVFGYDNQGRLTRWLNPDGSAFTLTYDTSGRVKTLTDPEGVTSTLTTDADGNVVADGHTLQTLAGPVNVQWGYSFDHGGNLVGETLPDGTPIGIVRNAAGDPGTLTDGLGQTTAVRYTDTGQVQAVRTPTGATFQTEYDAAGRETGVVLPDGQRIDRTYDALGQLTAVSDPVSGPATVSYDAAGRVTAETDALGHLIQYTYDKTGRRTSVELPGGALTQYQYDAAGQLSAIIDPEGRVTGLIRDAAGRVVQTDFPDGTAIKTTYDVDGRVVTRTDRTGGTWTYEHTPGGRLRTVRDPAGQVTTYDYDGQGIVDRITDAKGNAREFLYDALGRLTQLTLPGGASEQRQYDADSRLVQDKDFAGDVITFAYDAEGRPILRQTPSDNETRAYDALGRLIEVTDARGMTSLTRDNAGRVTSFATPDGSVSYDYDAAGRVTAVAADGGTSTFAYTDDNQLAKVTDPGGGLTSYTRDRTGLPLQTTLPNGGVITRAFDPAGRLNRLTYADPGGKVLYDLAYTRDSAGRVTGTKEATGRSVSYSYDSLGRLIEETIRLPGGGTQAIHYEYDATGNLTLRDDGTPQVFKYDANDRLVTDGQYAYSWDANGRLAARTNGPVTETYTHDDQGRLVRFERSGPNPTRVDYTYDFDGLLASRTVDGVRSTFVWDRSAPLVPQLLEVRDANGKVVARYGRDDVGPREVDTASGPLYLITDALGTVRAVAGANGSVVSSLAFDGFGRPQAGSGPGELGYTGAYTDPVSGLVFLRSRWYDPNQARFIEPDQAEADPASTNTLNRYVYSRNDPVNRSDPSGQFDMLELQTAVTITSILASLALTAYPTPLEYVVGGLIGHVYSGGVPMAATYPFLTVGGTLGPVTLTGGLEYLTFNGNSLRPGTGALYFYYGLGLTSQFDTSGGSVTINTAAGVVLDTLRPADYSGWFFNISVSFGTASAGRILELLQQRVPTLGTILSSTSTGFQFAFSPGPYTGPDGKTYRASAFEPLGITFSVGTTSRWPRWTTHVSVSATYYYELHPELQGIGIGWEGLQFWQAFQQLS
jgi:RHS repeat-associated protein